MTWQARRRVLADQVCLGTRCGREFEPPCDVVRGQVAILAWPPSGARFRMVWLMDFVQLVGREISGDGENYPFPQSGPSSADRRCKERQREGDERPR
jgi:hypothetical protein